MIIHHADRDRIGGLVLFDFFHLYSTCFGGELKVYSLLVSAHLNVTSYVLYKNRTELISLYIV